MIVTVLVENETISSKYQAKHGLCLYIETMKHRILFDLGPDDTFIKNAEKLNVNLREIDTVIISHGHKDHGGGLKAFLKLNHKAHIYIHEKAFLPYYTLIGYFLKYHVGLDAKLKTHSQITLVQGDKKIDEELYIFSDVTQNNLIPSSNQFLYTKQNNKYIQDSFAHEQHLIVTNEGQTILVAGCAHRGIVNIIEAGRNKGEYSITHCIGGMHLYNPVSKRCESNDYIESLGQELYQKPIKFYTCHCTGQKAFKLLEQRLREKILYLSTGQQIEIKKFNE